MWVFASSKEIWSKFRAAGFCDLVAQFKISFSKYSGSVQNKWHKNQRGLGHEASKGSSVLRWLYNVVYWWHGIKRSFKAWDEKCNLKSGTMKKKRTVHIGCKSVLPCGRKIILLHIAISWIFFCCFILDVCQHLAREDGFDTSRFWRLRWA